jgi:hypothetical protein
MTQHKPQVGLYTRNSDEEGTPLPFFTLHLDDAPIGFHFAAIDAHLKQ